jgi:hypothetical protein
LAFDAAGAAIDFVVGREAQYSPADLFDCASHIGAEDCGRVGSDRHLAASDPDIDLVDRRRSDADQHHAGRIAGLGTSVSAKFAGPPDALRIWARIRALAGKDGNRGTSEAEAPIRLGVGG